MPIFEEGEPINEEELRRQQPITNRKAFEREVNRIADMSDDFDGGDMWDEE